MALSIKTVKKRVLTKIKPKKKETKLVDDVVAKINQALKVNELKAKCIIGGSFAKDTFLKNDYDVDLFVRFDYKKFLPTDNKGGLSEILLGVLSEIFKNVERVHGSRDYFSLKIGKFEFEIIPVLDITNPKKAMNVTDMSPLHVNWVQKHKKGEEIRLSKAFCKASKCYGAESYLKGFSGHVLDILTIKYGSFEKFMKACSKWDEEIKKTGKIVVDINNVYKGKALQKLNKSKTHSPLIIIDPVLSERNAAAALSRERFDVFVNRAKKFIENPGTNFFEKRSITKSGLKKKTGKNTLIFLNVKALDGKEDVVGAKILKVFTHLKKYLRINEFIVKNLGWEFNKDRREAVIYFIIDSKILPERIVRVGPPLSQKKHCEEFVKRNIDSFSDNGRLYADLERPYRTPLPLVKDMIRDKYIKEKVKSIKLE